MNNLILRLEEIPLSGQDLVTMANKMGNNDVRWMPYDDLQKLNNIRQLFEGGINTVYLLLRIHRDDDPSTIGHWISLSFDRSGQLNFYDPYALLPNQDLAETGEPDLLTKLLGNVPLNVNRHRHQKLKEAQNECGRHTVIRSLFHFMSNNQYNDLVIMPPIRAKWIIDADAMVTLMTAFLSKSDMVVEQFFMSAVPKKRFTNTSKPADNKGMGGSVIG